MERRNFSLPVLFSVALIVLSFLAYYNTLGNSIVWDDYGILESPSIRSLDLETVKSYFVDRNAYHAPGEIYRPLYPLSFALDYAMHGTNPRGYHLTNLILHSAATLMVFAFVAALLGSACQASQEGRGFSKRHILLAAFAAAALFTLHPIHTESVAWIKARDDILCSIFFFSAFLFYIRFVRARSRAFCSYVFSLILFLFALLSKEMAVTLPVLLVLHDLCFDRVGLGRAKRWLAYLPYFVLLVAFMAVRTSVLGQVGQMGHLGGGLYVAMLNSMRIIATYVGLLFFPVGLSADYMGMEISRSIDMRVVLSTVVLLFVVAVGIFAYTRSRLAAFAVFFFFITIAPVSHVIPLKIQLAERFLYIPSLAAVLIAAFFVMAALERTRGELFRKVVPVVVILLALGGLVATRERNKVWANEFTLWGDVIEKYPSARAYTSYGLAFEESGNLKEAKKYYELSTKTDPYFSYGWNNLGVIYLKEGRYNEAAARFMKALELEPGNAAMHANLGRAFEGTGNYSEALGEYREALRIAPGLEYARKRLQRLERGPRR